MNERYFKTPTDYCIARIGKVGSSAISKAVVATYYPERLTPPGEDTDGQHQITMTPNPDFVSKEDVLAGKSKAIILVRDVVERFKSACGETNIAPADALDQLEAGRLIHDFHFRPVIHWSAGFAVHLRFPEDLHILCDLTGLPEIPLHNTAEQRKLKKPELELDQIGHVLEFYAQDHALRESCPAVGK